MSVTEKYYEEFRNFMDDEKIDRLLENEIEGDYKLYIEHNEFGRPIGYIDIESPEETYRKVIGAFNGEQLEKIPFSEATQLMRGDSVEYDDGLRERINTTQKLF